MIYLLDEGKEKVYSPIYVCDSDYADKILDSMVEQEDGAPYYPFGIGACYIICGQRNMQGDLFVTTICNEDGNAWADDWNTFGEAYRYCKGEIDSEGNEYETEED